MSIDLPDLEDLTERLTDSFKGAFPGDDVSPTSDNFKRLRVNALAGLQVNHNLGKAEDDILVDSAAGTFLDRHGFVHGVTRKLATPARKADAGRVVGTVGSTVTLGTQLTSDGGLTFQINENATVPAAGFIDVDIIGVSTGSATKLPRLEVLRFITPPAGIQQEVELQLALDEDGQDLESDGAYRTRIINAIQQPGAGGNANDWRNFALEETGIATAFVYPLRNGKGTVDITALHAGRGTVRVLTGAEDTALTALINAKRPVSIKDSRILTVATLAVDVDLKVTPLSDLQYTFDWGDATPPTVTAYNSTTRVMTLSARPSDLQAGDRIVIRPTAALTGTGEVFVAEQLGPGALDITLNKNPSPLPVATDTVFAGGPLTNTVRDAILAHLDALGTARGSFASGDWVSDIDPTRLLAVALGITGVAAGSVVAPGGIIVSADVPPADSIQLLIPGRVVVRRT